MCWNHLNCCSAKVRCIGFCFFGDFCFVLELVVLLVFFVLFVSFGCLFFSLQTWRIQKAVDRRMCAEM